MRQATLALRSATVVRLVTSHPGDTHALTAWLASNERARPRCVLGKTEGNGCVNDFTRGYASLVVEQALRSAGRLEDTSIIMSGGTEGVLTPHILVFADVAQDTPSVAGPPTALSLGVARTRDLGAHEIGRRAQVEATHEAVLSACRDAHLSPADVCFAQIKCPLLTPERVAAAALPCATHDGYTSMGLSRGASALGVALATGELSRGDLDAAVERLCEPDGLSGFSSSVASASAGIELRHSEVFVLGNAAGSASPLRAAHCVMRDALDSPAVCRMLAEAGLSLDNGQLTPASQARVRAVLAKADPAAAVRGERTTMCSDSDLHATRHARAAVGGLLAGLTGCTNLYVSGGAEHQGPAGGGPVCVVYEAGEGEG